MSGFPRNLKVADIDWNFYFLWLRNIFISFRKNGHNQSWESPSDCKISGQIGEKLECFAAKKLKLNL